MRCSTSGEAISLIVSGRLQCHRALPPSRFRIMSNRGRPEGPNTMFDENAGIKFAQLVRQHGYEQHVHTGVFPPRVIIFVRSYNGPLMIFCGNVSSVNAVEAIRLGVTVTQDINTAARFASFAPENARYSLRDAGADHGRRAFPRLFSLHHAASFASRFNRSLQTTCFRTLKHWRAKVNSNSYYFALLVFASLSLLIVFP